MNRNDVKFVVRNVVSFCVGGTVVAVIKENTFPQTRLKKTEIAVGSMALSLMMGEMIAPKTDAFVDAVYDFIDKKEDPHIIRP